MKDGCLRIILIVVTALLLFLPVYGIMWAYHHFRPWDEHPARAQSSSVQKWYQGGTLLHATPDQWKKAEEKNKLATCADCLAKLWSDKKLKPSIQDRIKSIDDMKPYCEQLVNEIDQALRSSKDSPKVSEAAAAAIQLLGWSR